MKGSDVFDWSAWSLMPTGTSYPAHTMSSGMSSGYRPASMRFPLALSHFVLPSWTYRQS